ncbi:MAG: hypothetical protein ABSA71_05785 [Desulfomonilia bacterium]|jgi:DNA-directed RNA polymerase specialized sigma subunit
MCEHNEHHTFIELCISGNALMEEIDDFIEEWHKSSNSKEIHEFLGMSLEEYSSWVVEPDILPFIITSRIEHKSLAEIIEENESLPIAARTSSPKNAKLILAWLKKQRAK